MNAALSLSSRKLLRAPTILATALHLQTRTKSELAAHVSALQLCARLPEARALHARLLATGLQASHFAATALISLYSRFARPADALSVFLSSPAPNLAAWNAAISALAANSRPYHALQLYLRLRRQAALFPDDFTYPCVIKACADLEAQECVRTIQAELFKVALDPDVFTSSALVHAYLRFKLPEDAQKVFDELVARDVVLWNAMVTGFSQMGQFARATEYFHRMAGEGVVPSKFTVTGILSVFTSTADLISGRKIHGFVIKVGYDDDVAVLNAVIDLYGKCQALEDAAAVFKSMQVHDIFSWNSMTSALVCCGDDVEALHLFVRMRSNVHVRPDAITVAAVLPACSRVAALRRGREVHAYMVVAGIRGSHSGDVFVDNALTDMYAKCGVADNARLVFDSMFRRDTASWNIMIDAYASHGRVDEALEMFERMQEEGAAPDEVTFIGVLSACSHAGKLGFGREVLQRMLPEFGVMPAAEHYVCVVDMLGRAGLLDEAREVAVAAPVGAAAAWRAYLAACRARGQMERAVEAASRVVEMEPEESGGWVLLSNAYGWAGKFREVAEVRRAMRWQNVRKAPGCSWVELGSGLHAFITGDRAHRETEAIYKVLDILTGRLRECGYVPEVLMRGESHQ